MKYFLLSVICLFATVISTNAQEDKKEADTSMSAKEARRFKKLLESAQYPVIKSHSMAGILPVTGINAWPDSTQQYKLLFIWTLGSTDSIKTRKANFGLTEVGRIYNLHVASGIPVKNIHAVVAVHGLSAFSLLNEEAYRKKFNRTNPNAKLLKELQDAGLEIIVCGQAMGFLRIPNEALLPGIKIALTAQTIISSYAMKGYVLINENEEE